MTLKRDGSFFCIVLLKKEGYGEARKFCSFFVRPDRVPLFYDRFFGKYRVGGAMRFSCGLEFF
jgi:hypothetical protein